MAARPFPWSAFLLFSLWIWAIWSCAEHWEANPNYSYGWVVPALGLGFAIRRYLRRSVSDPMPVGLTVASPVGIIITLLIGAAAFFLEYPREQVWHPVIVIWSIATIAVGSTLILFWLRGGRELARAEFFPVCFFFTAVPWPPRFEQPITSKLMHWVASATTESLHWLGIEAQVSGGAIALSSGLVGITEACSGIRSLQAGIMFGLAMGEWFLLSARRRVLLLVIAIGLAVVTNFGRTLALALQAQQHGIESIDRVHDLIGNITITTLVLAIWAIGKLLASPAPTTGISRSTSALRHLLGAFPTRPIFAAMTIAFICGVGAARALSGHLDAQAHSQVAPFFTAMIDNDGPNRAGKIPREVWNELRPTSGEYVRREDPALPRGSADSFHFFWKPSPWNRFALVHRPDICMPGIGWKMNGQPETRDIDFDGHRLQFYVFQFQRGNARALELWGAWRNGNLVPVDYKPDQVLGVAMPPASMYLEGKRGSATEIISCSVISENSEVSADIAVEILRSTFKYKPQ